MNSSNSNLKLSELKIILTTHAYPPDPGGIAAFARDIYVALKNAGCSITVFKAQKKNKRSTGRISNYMQMIEILLSFFGMIKKKKPDVIICSRMLSSGLMAVLASFFFQTKIIVQVHGTELKGRYGRGWRRWMLRRLYNRADQIWANSKFTMNLLEEYGCEPSRIEIIYPFITKDAQTLARTFSNKNSNAVPIVFTAASLYPRKGIDLVLKSLSKLPELDWEYRIAGEPQETAYVGYYEKMAEDLGVDKKVTFLGQLDREKLWSEMAGADIFVMPSRGYENDIESFGIVFIEAALFGVPSIGTKVGGIEEAIGHSGILIEDENIDELTNSIKYLITDKENRDTLSQKALNRVKENFTEKRRRKDMRKALASLHFE